ncbi:sulfatase [Halopelagius fulvigenes]|uniref:Sulfatase n=1 Tax=Halopelagius fulvigenes TaxID=1198324 RepID=A0ABD5TV44_9EURY
MDEASKPNVLLLAVDACRADYLPPYGGSADAPAIDRLADEGTVFERALSPAPWTLPAMTSVLTGRYPHEHGATSRGFELDAGRTVTRDLAAAGYRTLHLSPKTWIGDWLPQGRGFDRVEEFTGPEHRYFDGGEDVRTLSKGVTRGPEWYATVVRRALASDAPLKSLGNVAAFQLQEATGDAWLDNVRASERAARIAEERFAELAADDRPFFCYAHLMNPHLPFYLPPEFRSDVRPPGCDTDEEETEWMSDLMDDIWAIRTGERTLDASEVAYLRARYRDELAYADAAIGRIVDALRERGVLDETLVVVTGDHGEHLGERVRGDPADPTTERTLLDHQTSIRFPLLRVPLVVRYPAAFDSDRRTDLVQTTGVAETIRAAAGLEYDESRSLLAADRSETRDAALAEYAGVVPSHPPESVEAEFVYAPRRTAVTGRWKLDAVGDARRWVELDWDAAEADAVDEGDVPPDARERLISTLSETEGTEGGASRDIPDDVAENLGDLGYL